MTTRTDLDNSFDLLQISLPFTRLRRYDDFFVFSVTGDIDFAVIKINSVINDMGLPLKCEVNNNVLFRNTVIVKSKY